MLAAYAARANPDDPLAALEVGDLALPETPQDWVTVDVKAASVNHHDLWSLRGVGLKSSALPMILGCDAAGVTEDGSEVIVHAVINDPSFAGDDSTLDPARSLLSERYPGTLAEKVRVPRQNLVPKPAELTFAEAACLPTAWLTAYRMLFTQSGLRPGDTVLIQGAGGGVSTALIALARQAGLRVWVTSRDEDKGAQAVEWGAHQAYKSGERLPERVDAVMETVGAATWSHSVNSLRPGGTVVISGTTSGAEPSSAELTKIFFKPLRVIGSTMGTKSELESLVNLLVTTGLRPPIHASYELSAARDAFEQLAAGTTFGKLTLTRH